MEIDKNRTYITDCISEINELQKELNLTESTDDTSLNFIVSLKELHSYLIINRDMLEDKKKEIEKVPAIILNIDTLKEFILQKKNMLDTIESNISDKELYRRSLKLLLYDLVDKILYKEDESIEIIIK